MGQRHAVYYSSKNSKSSTDLKHQVTCMQVTNYNCTHLLESLAEYRDRSIIQMVYISEVLTCTHPVPHNALVGYVGCAKPRVLLLGNPIGIDYHTTTELGIESG